VPDSGSLKSVRAKRPKGHDAIGDAAIGHFSGCVLVRETISLTDGRRTQ